MKEKMNKKEVKIRIRYTDGYMGFSREEVRGNATNHI